MKAILLSSAALLMLVSVTLSVASFRGRGRPAALKGMIAMTVMLFAAIPVLVYGSLDG
jgi:hypothetical protein